MTEFPGWSAPIPDVRHWLCYTLQEISKNGYEECQEFLRKREGEVDTAVESNSSVLPAIGGQKPVEFYPTCKPQSLLEVAMLVLFSVSLAICFLVVYFVFRWYRCNVIHRPTSTWALSASRLPPIVYSSSLRTEIQGPMGGGNGGGLTDGGFTIVSCNEALGNSALVSPLLRQDLPPSYVQVMQTADRVTTPGKPE